MTASLFRHNALGSLPPIRKRICQSVLIACGVFFATIQPLWAQALLRDAEIEEFLADYSHPIFEAAGLEPENIDILLLAGPPNAFAGGQTMGIFTGLITTADTPNQIEGVIAHEAGHIAGGHTARSDEALASATRPMLLSLVLAAGAVAAGAPDAGLGILGLGQTIGVANALKYSRSQESAADQAAVSYLDEIGHSSQGLIEFFGKLRNSQIITGYRTNPYFQTHPLANARITALRERAGASPHFEAKDSEDEVYRLRMIQAKIHGFLDQAHHTLRRYPETDQSDPAHYARAVAYYRSANIDRGLKEIDYLLDKFPENEFFHELKGQMLFEFGRVADSIEPHKTSVQLDPTEPLFRINLGRAYLATEDKTQMPMAVQEFKAALLAEPDNSFAWFEMARAYGAMENEPMAYLATAESKYHTRQNIEAAQFAQRAMRGLERGTPEWQQAADIIFAATGKGPNEFLNEQRDRKRPAPQDRRDPNEQDVPDPTFRGKNHQQF
ncbi:MAG: M48 family metalloprotease [Pseudomonadota bacterium]